jgi:hypothetical protein
VALGRKLAISSQVINWYIGDWWAAGQHRYGARAKAAAEGIFDKEFQAVADIASVCRAFESSRRREVLSFTHHREVAALPPEQADRLLTRAEDERLSTRELRREVRRHREHIGELVPASRMIPADEIADREFRGIAQPWNEASTQEPRVNFVLSLGKYLPQLANLDPDDIPFLGEIEPL